jgi:hypothetical protein
LEGILASPDFDAEWKLHRAELSCVRGCKMSFSAFLCLRCGSELTDLLREQSEDEIVWEKGRQAVPVGRRWTYREFVTCSDPGASYVTQDGARTAFTGGDFLLHQHDVRYTVKPGACVGCCGWQPRDEANIQCVNGHDVGTLHADECWAPLVLRLIAGMVEQVIVGPSDDSGS